MCSVHAPMWPPTSKKRRSSTPIFRNCASRRRSKSNFALSGMLGFRAHPGQIVLNECKRDKQQIPVVPHRASRITPSPISRFTVHCAHFALCSAQSLFHTFPMANETLLQLDMPGIRKLKSGKVREIFDLGDRLLFVASDRISAFDVIMPIGIPLMCVVLTQIFYY